MVCWSLIHPHYEEIKAPPTWCTYKGFVGDHSDLTPMIRYHKIVEYKMKQY